MDATRAITLSDRDNVATALSDIPSGASVQVRVGAETVAVQARERIPFGFKIAVRPIPRGDLVYKYGEIIGRASSDIETGDMAHVHNIEGTRARGDLEEQVKP
jgi:altronate dehydratase small subunit